MITRRGVGIIAVAIAVFFLASTTRVGWVHLADAVLWGVILVSLAVPWLSMPGLRVKRTLQRGNSAGALSPTEGTSIPVELQLENRWWLPRFLVSLSFPVSVGETSSERRSIFFWTWPRRTSATEEQVGLDQRGQHSLGDALVEITGPFGMFRRRRTFPMKDGVLVYPRWVPMDRIGAMEAQSGEQEGRRKARTGSDAAGTRAYVPGDPYRSIHWRNSARSGRLSVREFDTWNDRAMVFAIDTVNITGEAPESSLDNAVRIAASCGRVVEQEGGTSSVLTASGESPEFMTWTGLMEHLARVGREHAGFGSLAQHMSGLQPGRRVMAFLTSASSEEIQAVATAAQRGLACAAVMFSEKAGEIDGVGAAVLRQAGVQVFECLPGRLESIVRELEAGVAGTVLRIVSGADEAVAA